MGSIWAVISECALPCRRGPELSTEDFRQEADTKTILEERPKVTLEEQDIITAKQADAQRQGNQGDGLAFDEGLRSALECEDRAE